MDHYEAEFNLIWDCSQIVEEIDYKDCCAFEDHFKFKLESFVRWICEDSKSGVTNVSPTLTRRTDNRCSTLYSSWVRQHDY